MPKLPDDAISQLQTLFCKNRVKRNNLAFIDVVPYLPTNTPFRFQGADAHLDDFFLSFKVFIQMDLSFVWFS
jgi:hypothetical protein